MFRYVMCLFLVVFLIPAQAARIALVIGNAAYDEKSTHLGLKKLRNPVFDARDMAAMLESLGYEVILKTDLRKKAMTAAIRDFSRRLKQRSDVGVFYFSGHGFQYKNISYLLPLGAEIQSNLDLDEEAIKADYVLRHMEQAHQGVNVMIFDACRDSVPEHFFVQTKGLFDNSLSVGLGSMKAPTGSLIAYATAPNKVSWGGLPGDRNSIYTKHLLEVLRQKAFLTVTDLFIDVRNRVMQDTKDAPVQQVPWETTSLTQQFCFGRCRQVAPSRVDVSKLLRQCDRYFKANYLTTGPAGTAFECYQEVLQKDKGNAEALAGLDKMAAKYANWAKRALDRGQKAKARRYLTALRQINPESPQLAALEVRLSPSSSSVRTAKVLQSVVLPSKVVQSWQGHGNGVCLGCLAFSPDGKILASASFDGTIKLWAVGTGKLLRSLTGHQDSVHALAFSPDGKWLVSGGKDNLLKLWEVSSGKTLRTLTGHQDWVLSVAFSPDGRRLASSSYQEIKLWDANKGQLWGTLTGPSGWVLSVAFSPKGRWLALGSDDNSVGLWEVGKGKQLLNLMGHNSLVRSVAFSAEGRWLASGSADHSVKLWDANRAKLLRTLTGHQDWVRSVAFSAEGRWLASGSRDKTIKLWKVNSGLLLRTLTGHEDDVYSVALGADGMLASGDRKGVIKLWR